MVCDRAMLTTTIRGGAVSQAPHQSLGQVCLHRLSKSGSHTLAPAGRFEVPAHCESRFGAGLTAPRALHKGCADRSEEQESDLSWEANTLIVSFTVVLPEACTSPQKALFLCEMTSSKPVEPGPARGCACHLSHRQFKSPSCDDLWCRTQAAARHPSVGGTRDVSCVASLQCSVLPGCLPIVVSPAQDILHSCRRRNSQLLVMLAGLLEAGGCP